MNEHAERQRQRRAADAEQIGDSMHLAAFGPESPRCDCPCHYLPYPPCERRNCQYGPATCYGWNHAPSGTSA